MTERIRILRAYRPSMSAAATQEDNEEARRQKESNLLRYSQRAAGGLPLFADQTDQTETEHIAQS